MITERILDPGFEPLRDRFAAHFERDDEFRELGAALVVYEHGRKVVDLVGGHLDYERTVPWTATSLVNIWSASKVAMAVAIAQLVDRGLARYDQRVAHYWPEFGQNGKKDISLEQVLSHRAGLNGFQEPTSASDLYDWELIVDRLARQSPLWTPDTTASYHGMTFGWLTGEIIRRITGQTPRDYIAENIASPLAADLHLGVPTGREADIAEIIPPEADRNPPTFNDIASHCIQNPTPSAPAANQRAWQQAQIPAVNVHASADGLARLYGALASRAGMGGIHLLSPGAVAAMTRPRGPARDEMLGTRQWGAGVALNTGGLYGPDAGAFGHSGWGGSFGCADPATGRGIAYLVNRMGSALNGDPRAQAIVELATATGRVRPATATTG